MTLGLARFWAVATALLLLACGGNATSQGDSGFQPVQTRQPTESGAWVIDPGDPLTLYALGHRSLRSRDGGHTWSELSWPADAQALLFAHEPVAALYLETGDLDGAVASKLFRSLNGGNSWTEVGAVSSGSLALVDQRSGPVLLNLRDDGIWTSADNGSTWVASALPVKPETLLLHLGRILVSSGAAPVVYVEAVLFDSAFESIVFVSTDAGATFSVRAVPGPPQPASPPNLSLDCHGRLYVLAGNTVNRSSDAGTTWETVATLETDVISFQVLQGAPSACSDAIYASGARTQESYPLWRLDAAGDVTSQTLPEGGTLSDLGNDRLLLVSDFDLRQRSDDGGRSWWTAGITLQLGDLLFSPAREGLLFVSTVGGVFRSDDGGKLWQRKHSHSKECLYADPKDPNVLYARSGFDGGSPSTVISTDGGASFQNWPVPTAESPERPLAIASSATGKVTVVSDRGVYTTEDAGRQFTTLLTLPAGQTFLWAAIGASEPQAIFASVAIPDTTVPPILASLDGGATWTSSDPGTYVDFLVAHPADSQIAFARSGWAEYAGLLRTLDGGRTWSRIDGPQGETSVSLRIDSRPPYALYASGSHLYRSNDKGTTWQTLAALPTAVFDFELDPQPGGAPYILSQRGLLEKLVE